MDRRIFLIMAIAVFISLSFMRVTNVFYSTDSQNHFDAAMLILEEGKFSTKNFTHAWIKINDVYYPSQPIGFPILALPIVKLFNFDTDIAAGDRLLLSNDFYQAEYDGDGQYRWVANRGSFLTYSSEHGNVLDLNFLVKPFLENKTLKISHNGKIIYSKEQIPQWTKVHLKVLLDKGWNDITLADINGCGKVNELVPVSNDDRCLSFAIRDTWYGFDKIAPIKLDRTNEINFIEKETFVANITNFNEFDAPVRLRLIAWSYDKPANLTLAINETELNYTVTSSGNEIITPFFNLKPGKSIITVSSTNGCKRVMTEACIVAGVSSLDAIPFESFIYDDLLYTGDWFLAEGGTNTWRWMSINSSIMTYSPEEKDSILSFAVWSYHKPRKLEVYANGNLEISRTINSITDLEIPVHLKSGNNMINLYSSDGCDIPKEKEGSPDLRCLTFAFKKITIR